MAREEEIDVLMAGYLSKAAAEEDFKAVEATKAPHHGMVIVSKDLEGQLTVEQQDHAVRKGAMAFGGAGFVIGLFAPPLLAATAVGAAIGAGVGKIAQRKVKSEIEKQAEATIPIGGAGLIVAYPHTSAYEIEGEVKRAIKKVVGQAKGKHVKALKAAMVDASTKMAASDG